METELEVNDFVEIKFEGEFGDQSPIKGQVLEVDYNPEIHQANFVFVMRDSNGERDLVYGEGSDEKDSDWSNVSVRNRNITLGTNASWRKLE